MNDHDALLAAVLAGLDTGERTPAGPYADYLEEKGLPGAHLFREYMFQNEGATPLGSSANRQWIDSPRHAGGFISAGYDKINPRHNALELNMMNERTPEGHVPRIRVHVRSKEHARQLISDMPDNIKRHLEDRFIPHLPDEPVKLARPGPTQHDSLLHTVKWGVDGKAYGPHKDAASIFADWLQDHGLPNAAIIRAFAERGRNYRPGTYTNVVRTSDGRHMYWAREIAPAKGGPKYHEITVLHAPDNAAHAGVYFSVPVHSKADARALISDLHPDVKAKFEKNLIPRLPDEPVKLSRPNTPDYWALLNRLADEQAENPHADQRTGVAPILADHLDETGHPALAWIFRHSQHVWPLTRTTNRSPHEHPSLRPGNNGWAGHALYYPLSNIARTSTNLYEPSDGVVSHNGKVRLLNHRDPAAPMVMNVPQAPIIHFHTTIPAAHSTKENKNLSDTDYEHLLADLEPGYTPSNNPAVGHHVKRTVSLSAHITPEQLHEYIRLLPKSATRATWTKAAESLYGRPVKLARPRGSDYWGLLNSIADAQDAGGEGTDISPVLADYLQDHNDPRHIIARLAQHARPYNGDIPNDHPLLGQTTRAHWLNNVVVVPRGEPGTLTSHGGEVQLLDHVRSRGIERTVLGNERAPVLYWQAKIPEKYSTKMGFNKSATYGRNPRVVHLSASVTPEQLHEYIAGMPKSRTRAKWQAAANSLYGPPPPPSVTQDARIATEQANNGEYSQEARDHAADAYTAASHGNKKAAAQAHVRAAKAHLVRSDELHREAGRKHMLAAQSYRLARSYWEPTKLWLKSNGSIETVRPGVTHEQHIGTDLPTAFANGHVRLVHAGKELYAHNDGPFNSRQLSALRDYAIENGIERVNHERQSGGSREISVERLARPAAQVVPTYRRLARVRYNSQASAVGEKLSANHASRVDLAKRILHETGLTPSTVRSVLSHTDERGVRPGIAAVIHKDIPDELLHYATAWLGMLLREKKMTVFKPGAGEDSLHIITTSHSPAETGEYLKRMGAQFSLDSSGSGTRAFIVNPSIDTSSAAKGLSGSVQTLPGTAKRFGSGDDTTARAKYRDTISSAEKSTGSTPGPSGVI